ncbi:hypothetical protein F5Y14DRAFT_453723 [Nemania sp. NC0429]|nr:hypothetical protein F5Y14DRAFT_453723 [Nemania sp. NC0429]
MDIITHQESAHLVALMRVLLLLTMGTFRLPVVQQNSGYQCVGSRPPRDPKACKSTLGGTVVAVTQYITSFNGISSVTIVSESLQTYDEGRYGGLFVWGQGVIVRRASSDPPWATESPTNSSNSSTGLGTGAKIGIGVGVSLGVLFIIGVAIVAFIIRKRKRQAAQGRPVDQNQIQGYSLGPVELDEQQKAWRAELHGQ